jgi:hypothetical protein
VYKKARRWGIETKGSKIPWKLQKVQDFVSCFSHNKSNPVPRYTQALKAAM